MSNNNLLCPDCNEEHHPAAPCQPEPESGAVFVEVKSCFGDINSGGYWSYPIRRTWYCGLCGYGKSKCDFYKPDPDDQGNTKMCIHNFTLNEKGEKQNPTDFTDFCYNQNAQLAASKKK